MTERLKHDHIKKIIEFILSENLLYVTHEMEKIIINEDDICRALNLILTGFIIKSIDALINSSEDKDAEVEKILMTVIQQLSEHGYKVQSINKFKPWEK